jgi:hypothetical protein
MALWTALGDRQLVVLHLPGQSMIDALVSTGHASCYAEALEMLQTK